MNPSILAALRADPADVSPATEAEWGRVLGDLVGELRRIARKLDESGYTPAALRKLLGFCATADLTLGRGVGRSQAIGELVVEGGRWYQRAVATAARTAQLRAEFFPQLERVNRERDGARRDKGWRWRKRS